MTNPFEGISGQDQVTGFLAAALSSGGTTHAYLIAGDKDSGSDQIALRFAARLVGQGNPDEETSVLSGTHPDVQVLKPASAAGYLVEQVREVVHDAGLAPVRSSHKVYVVDSAESLRGAPANAFLKTLEEPPASVCIILLAVNEQSVLQTLRSRCQVLTCVSRASRQKGSFEVEQMVGDVARGADNRTLLAYAKRVVALSEEGVEGLKDAQAQEEAASADYLASGARKALEQRHKREVSMEQRNALKAVIAQMRGWLRDCLLAEQGAPELASSQDTTRAAVAQAAGVAGLVKALEACSKAEERISYNVTPQLAIEALLLEIREATCPQ